MDTFVHLHARVSDRDYCDTVCGKHCGDVDTAYRDRDPERVTCPDCIGSEHSRFCASFTSGPCDCWIGE